MTMAASFALSLGNNMLIVWSCRMRITYRKIERRATVHLRLGPNAASVALYNPLNNRQPDARAFKLVNTVQPLKYVEEFAGVFHVEPRAVVLHEIDALAVFLAPTDVNQRRIAVARVFDRVGKQVRKDLL